MKLAEKGAMCQGSRSRSERGFSLIELLIVVAIIVILLAVSIPGIASYIRNYEIRGAVVGIASELDTARLKAIGKNVNIGVVFMITANNQYQWLLEDDQHPQVAAPEGAAWFDITGENWPAMLGDPVQAGPVRGLPSNLQFTSPANCPGGSGAPTEWGVRFSRLGAACTIPNQCGFPASAPAYTPYMSFDAANGATICLQDPNTNLVKTVTITPGGRVLAQP